MTYGELLSTENWHLKRNNIIRRDKAKCTICANFRLYDKKEFGLVSGISSFNKGTKLYIESKFREEFFVFTSKRNIEPSATIIVYEYLLKEDKIISLIIHK
ncbi:hypothetical protein AHMF7605_15915 [Adhaeribacter arboris]|uniref:Uncharacterized protein n=1 Tax=Adhaeribacter arboris TaxID=2072846 RepID=A0A2T2YHA0_9BACT|nr:hypothetical protein [Adhaeribacter arboris]PSR54881.1 hypothetical protein AHMF7605_15915 [Adhaeribacter arboris]